MITNITIQGRNIHFTQYGYSGRVSLTQLNDYSVPTAILKGGADSWNVLLSRSDVARILARINKQQLIMDDVEDLIATHERSNHHYLTNKEIVNALPQHKKKHIKAAIKELR